MWWGAVRAASSMSMSPTESQRRAMPVTGPRVSDQHAVMYHIVESDPDLDQVGDEGLRALIVRLLAKPASERPSVDKLLADRDEEYPSVAGASWLPTVRRPRPFRRRRRRRRRRRTAHLPRATRVPRPPAVRRRATTARAPAARVAVRAYRTAVVRRPWAAPDPAVARPVAVERRREAAPTRRAAGVQAAGVRAVGVRAVGVRAARAQGAPRAPRAARAAPPGPRAAPAAGVRSRRRSRAPGSTAMRTTWVSRASLPSPGRAWCA